MDQYHPEKAEYPQLYREEKWFADFTANNTIYEKFPFSMWRKVMREVLSEYDMELVQRAHFLGVRQLREVIADYLYLSLIHICYFTGRNWMDMENYDLPINASRIDYDQMIVLIKDYMRLRGFLE